MYLRDYWKRKNNTTKWIIFLQNVVFLKKAYRMKKSGTIKKNKEYTLKKEEITSLAFRCDLRKGMKGFLLSCLFD